MQASVGKMENFLVTIDVIESLTGEGFFCSIGEQAQKTFEHVAS